MLNTISLLKYHCDENGTLSSYSDKKIKIMQNYFHAELHKFENTTFLNKQKKFIPKHGYPVNYFS